MTGASSDDPEVFVNVIFSGRTPIREALVAEITELHPLRLTPFALIIPV